METRFDKEADDVYIKFTEGEFAKNKVVDDFTVLDLDKDGNLLGIELLDVSKRLPAESLSKVIVKNMAVAAQ